MHQLYCGHTCDSLLTNKDVAVCACASASACFAMASALSICALLSVPLDFRYHYFIKPHKYFHSSWLP